jgi:hypothetical protein
MRRHCIRLAVAAAVLLALVPVLLAPPKDEPKLTQITGKVVPLKGVLEKFGAKLDADAAATWLALVTDDGKVYPIIKDDGGRMFFKDTRLLNRPMRLTGRLLPDTHLFQVMQVHSVHKDGLWEVYYWCDVCAIKRFEKKDCDCCGAPMELRETPVKK